MGEHWFVIYRLYDDGSKQIVPVFSEEGRRLAYHVFDAIYYGHTLQWRRQSEVVRSDLDPLPMSLIESTEDLCEFDYNLRALKSRQKYRVYFYGDHSMHMELPRADRYLRQLLLTKDFTIN
jgi:hypothetical protein